MMAALAFRRIPPLLVAFGLLLLAALAIPARAFADGIFVPAVSRVDGVFSPDNRFVYITNGDQVLRYDLQTQGFAPSFVLGGRLRGIDISPDGKTLAVADSDASNSNNWIYLVDIASGASKKVMFQLDYYEGGTYSVAYGSDGRLLVTSDFLGSGWVPLRRYDPATGETANLAMVMQSAMLCASADRATIAWAEPNNSGGPWGLYTVATGEMRTFNTQTGVYEIAISRNGEQVALPTYSGTLIYDADINLLKTLGEYAAGQPIGVAYHPTKDQLFTAWVGSPEVRAFDTNTFQQVDAFDVDYQFENNGNWAFTNGRLRMSQDGSLVFVTVKNGARVLKTTSATTETELTTSASQIVGGSPLTLTATVRRLAPSGRVATGSVSFYRKDTWGGWSVLGTARVDALGNATLAVDLPIGAQTMYAKFGGSLEDRSSVSNEISVEVLRASTATSLSLSNNEPVYGEEITVNVAVTQTTTGTPGTVTGSVAIWEGNENVTSIYLSPNGRGSRPLTTWDMGTHCLRATYSGDANNANSASEPVCYEVGKADTTIRLKSQVQPAGSGITVAITATVSALPPGQGIPTGSIALYEGASWLGNARLDVYGYAQLTILGLSNEPHILRVEYLGEPRYKPSNAPLLLGELRKVYLPLTKRE